MILVSFAVRAVLSFFIFSAVHAADALDKNPFIPSSDQTELADFMQDQEFLKAIEDIQRSAEKAAQEAEAAKMREIITKQEKSLAILSPTVRELVTKQLELVPAALLKIRLTETLKGLVVAMKSESFCSKELCIQLDAFTEGVDEGAVEALFFSDISQQKNPTPKVFSYTPAHMRLLQAELKSHPGQNSQDLYAILNMLSQTQYKEAAQYCYDLHADAIDAIEDSLRSTIAAIKKELLLEENMVPGDKQDALVFWSHQCAKHLNTVRSLKKLATKASTDFSWLLYSFSQLYNIVEPYFMLHGHFRFGTLMDPARIGGGQSFLNQTKIADIVARSVIAFTAMVQNPCDTAGRDLTTLMMGDASRVQFIDPLNEGTGNLIIGAFAKYVLANAGAAGSAFQAPSKFATQMSSLSLFMTRFACALAYHNIKAYALSPAGLPVANYAVGGDLNRAVLRLGIFSLQGYVSSNLQAILFQDRWRGALFQLEEFTMGIVAPELINEAIDVLVRAALMQHNPLVEEHLVKFNDFDIHGYTDYWYILRMYKAYMTQVPEAEWSVAGLAGYQSANQHLFYQYKALYYVFGALGRFWARKAVAANVDVISTYTGKAVRGALSLLDPKDDLELHPANRNPAANAIVMPDPAPSQMLNKNTISMILSMYLPMIMHHKGHPLRNSAIENLRAIGFIPLHEQDDQVINNQMMSAVVQFCLNWGIFDYKSAYECMQKYRENSHNIAPFVPYLVDKIADGMLISLGGVAGKFLGWKVAEQLFPDPQPVGGQPFPLVAAV